MTPERNPIQTQGESRARYLGDLATHLQRIREQERALLARELHDELGAILTAAKLDVACLKSRLDPASPEIDRRLQHLAEMLGRGIALKSRVVEGLCPSSLANLGLASSLNILCRDFSLSSTIAVTTAIEEVRAEDASELAIYRLVQECLTNIGKYACASMVSVTLVDAGKNILVEVLDNGIGFDIEQVSSSRYGLAGMRHRVQSCGGRLTVTSAQGQGTHVMAMLPKVAVESAKVSA